MKIRVALVEDDAELAAQLSTLIGSNPGFSCQYVARSGEDAVRTIPELNPDVVLMDISLTGIDGIQTLRELKRASPSINVVMLTVSRDSKRLFEALKAGASGYLLKRTSMGKLLEAIQEVHEGGAPMSGQIARQVVEFFWASERKLESLTAREHEVLVLLAEGHLYKEIADRMGVSLNTIRTYIRLIYEKLHVNSRAQAVLKLGRRE